jgi:negative regulator of flagellin synthesis FlgM
MATEIKLSNAGVMLTPHKMHAKSAATEEKAATTSAVNAGDRVSVTDAATRLQKIEAELSTLPEVNHEKVAEIKKAIADGTFSLDPARIAEKMIDFESSRKL